MPPESLASEVLFQDAELTVLLAKCNEALQVLPPAAVLSCQRNEEIGGGSDSNGGSPDENNPAALPEGHFFKRAIPLATHNSNSTATSEEGESFAASTLARQVNAPWNLVRVSTLDPDNSDWTSYFYRNTGMGQGVDVYIVDSGRPNDRLEAAY